MPSKRFCYEYPRPAVTTDCVVFCFDEGELKVLLIKRKNEPFLGEWAFPGGFLDIDEDCDECALRELHEETGIKNVHPVQLNTFSDVDRDPRERVISVSYIVLLKPAQKEITAGDDASDAEWFGVKKVPRLAFDHRKILDTALDRIRNDIKHKPAAFALLPDKFTLTQLLGLYQTILDAPLERRSFSKKFLSPGILKGEGEKMKNSMLYSFDRKKYDELSHKGYEFRI